MKKKSQTEILGLAIVVVIICFGLVLFLSYSGNDSTNDELKEMNEELANNFVNTLLYTTACTVQVRDLLIDLGRNGPPGSIECSGMSNFKYLNETVITPILDQTLNLWRKNKYNLTIYVEGSSTSILSYGTGCRTVVADALYPTSLGTGSNINVELKICG